MLEKLDLDNEKDLKRLHMLCLIKNTAISSSSIDRDDILEEIQRLTEGEEYPGMTG
jgi:hypothetical protein